MNPPAPVTSTRVRASVLAMCASIGAFGNACLERAASAHDRAGRPRKNQQIELKRLIHHVVQVKLSCLVHEAISVTIDLPPAGNSGTDEMTSVLPGFVARDNLGQLRSRSDQTHVAT